MKKWLKYIAATLLVFVELALVSCAMAPDLVIPCWIEPQAAKYADVNVPGLLPYTTLHDARQVARGMNYQHLLNQIMYERLLADEKVNYDYLNNAHSIYIKEGEQLKEAVFTPAGPLGILLGSMIGGTGMLFVDKPGTRKRLDAAKAEGVQEANGGK